MYGNAKNALRLVEATRCATTKFPSAMGYMVNHGYDSTNSSITLVKSHCLLNNQFKRQLHTKGETADTTEYWKIKIPSFIAYMKKVKQPENCETVINNCNCKEEIASKDEPDLVIDDDGKICIKTKQGLKVLNYKKIMRFLQNQNSQKQLRMDKCMKYLPDVLFLVLCIWVLKR